jgi:hypothetical protein
VLPPDYPPEQRALLDRLQAEQAQREAPPAPLPAGAPGEYEQWVRARYGGA